MRINHIHILSFILIASVLCISCKNKSESVEVKKTESDKTNTIKRVSVIKVLSPKAGELYTIGDKVNVQLALKDADITIDSLILENDGKKSVLGSSENNYFWITDELSVGNNKLKIYAYSNGNKVDSYTLKLRFKSDIVPEFYECEVINTYPHDKTAFTQGLIYEDGIMYEGTGQRGKSVLRKMKFETGDVISELSIPDKYFGEGVTIFGDKIIQLTWTSRIGFVYDKNTFKLINTLEYPTQGWGLTNDGERLIMSDGTQTIHFLDHEYFNEISKIEVYDNNGPVQNLNELEYFDELIYANVYQDKIIVAIDPKTGKVIKKINCSELVPKGYENEQEYVLNGIAYDKDNNRIFITGKNWPNLFEVKFLKK